MVPLYLQAKLTLKRINKLSELGRAVQGLEEAQARELVNNCLISLKQPFSKGSSHCGAAATTPLSMSSASLILKI